MYTKPESLVKGDLQAQDDLSESNKAHVSHRTSVSSEVVGDINEKALLRKIDMHVIPWLTILYLCSFLDRGSVANAKLYDLEKDLGISDRQYNIALTVFFIPYAVFEPASNVLVKRLRPSRLLPAIVVLWSIVTTMHGVMRNYQQFVVLRVLLGLAEAGLYPGVVFYMSCWYKKNELGVRVAVFFSAATVAGAFSGLLATAIVNLDGVRGKPGWTYIFLLEGCGTFLIGVASFFLIADFPDTAKFLTPSERAFVMQRLQDDSQFSAAGEQFSYRSVRQALLDWKTWVAMGLYAGFDGPLFAFSLFTPTIINQLGYRATEANLLSVPVYAFGCLVTCFVGFLGDRIGNRGRINLVLFAIGLVAYVILIASRIPGLSYFAIYLAVASIYATIPNSVAWVASNVEGSYKRSVTLGIAIGFGNLNGAVTSNVYRAVDKPWYGLGHGIVLVYLSIGWLSSLLFLLLLKAENAKRARGDRDEIIANVVNPNAQARNGRYDTVEAARRRKGDEWSGFTYTL